MVAINTITVELWTQNIDDAKTDGDIFIGICGREFSIDTDEDIVEPEVDTNDFEQGQRRIYICGADPGSLTIPPGTNVVKVRYGDLNDPRSPYPLDTDNLASYPVYIRFEPPIWRGGDAFDDHWGVEYVGVRVNPFRDTQHSMYEVLAGSDKLWLGRRSGKTCYLHQI